MSEPILEQRYGGISWVDRQELLDAGIEALQTAGIPLGVDANQIDSLFMDFDDKVGTATLEAVYSLGVQEVRPVHYMSLEGVPEAIGSRVISRTTTVFSPKKRHPHRLRFELETVDEAIGDVLLQRAVLAQIVVLPTKPDEAKTIIELSAMDYAIGSILMRYWAACEKASLDAKSVRVTNFLHTLQLIRRVHDTGDHNGMTAYEKNLLAEMCQTFEGVIKRHDKS